MRLLALIATLIFSVAAHADDLFRDGRPIDYVKGEALDPTATLGGYPIYKGNGNGWKIYQLTSTQADAHGNADAVNVGSAVFLQPDASGNIVASMAINANLGSASPNQYWGGSPCSGNHLFALNKNRAQDDNCVTIDAASYQSGSSNVTYFAIRSTQTGSNGRLMVIEIKLFADLLGFRNTAPTDWSQDALGRVPERKDFMLRMQQWAGQLQDASHRALDFKKPADAFDSVPSYRDLLPAVVALL